MTVTPEPSSGRKLMKATAIMASGTLVSRVLGFVRVMMIAFVLGNGTRQADIFSIAQTVPNSLFMLLAGGALNTVLVPQIVRAVRQDSDGGQKFVSRLMAAFLLLLAVMTVIITVITPLVLMLYTNSGWRTPELAAHWESMVFLAYLTMPQIFFYGAFFLVGQVLNARERFGPMMWAPVANNIVSILVFAAYAVIWGSSGQHADAFTTGQTLFLGIGATGGIVIQTIILMPYFSRIGFKFRLRFDFRGSGLGHTLRLARWTLLYVGVNQLALIVVDRLASAATLGGQGAGSTAYLNAYLVWIMPHSLITVSLATAMLPSASRMAAAGNLRGVADETMRTMRLSATFLLPSAIGFIALGLPFARLAFGHGTGSADADFVGWTLMAFALGLIPFTLQYVCLRAFYALEDTRITFFIQCIIASVNAALALVFVMSWNDPSTVAPRLAIAFSVAYAVGWAVSFLTLRKRLPGLEVRELARHLVRLSMASIPAGALAWVSWWLVSLWSDRLLAQVLGLSLAVTVAVVVFLALARQLKISEVQQTLSMLRRRGKNNDVAASVEQDADTGEPAPPSAAELDEALSAQLADDPAVIHTYPDAFDDHEPTGEVATIPGQTATVTAGQVLGDRYRLDELLTNRSRVLSWRAFDLTLSRPVLIHLLASGDPRTDSILSAARRSAAVNDARFLRVLDAAPVDADDYGAYIVCEYVSGFTLKKVLADGPLSSLEAAWVVRELADALTWVHALQLYHRQLNPDTVVITASGNVKIVGFLLEDILHPVTSDTTDGLATDLRSLGQLLYAALVSRWPGGPAYRMPAAPTAQGRVLSPREVVPGIPAVLGGLCDQLLNPGFVAEPGPDSALSVMVALTKILGTADATDDLERRVKAPIRPLFQPSGRTTSSPSAKSASVPLASADALTGPVPTTPEDQRLAPSLDGLDPTAIFPATGPLYTPVPPPAHPDSPSSAESEADTTERPAVRAASPRTPGSRTSPKRRYWLVALSALVVLVLIGSFAALAIRQAAQPSPDVPATSSPSATTSQSIKIARAIDFDPVADGGSGDEDTKNVGLAIDGNMSTQWRTESYRGNPKLGGLKPGVGLVVDLGSVQQVSKVTVTLAGSGTAVDVRVPLTATEGDSPPMRTNKEWRMVAALGNAQGTQTMQFVTPEKTRYLLVYLTSLPADGGSYRGGIFEIEVSS